MPPGAVEPAEQEHRAAQAQAAPEERAVAGERAATVGPVVSEALGGEGVPEGRQAPRVLAAPGAVAKAG